MTTVMPDYYSEFHCLTGACRHSCCIGWEIDVDPEALARFDRVPGALGEKLRQKIDRDSEPPHFILDPEDRCPFLQSSGLCELILELGEDSLCQICRDHPRFRNELPGRVEMGLGLCCEAAARLILGRKERVVLLGEPAGERDEILLKRNKALRILQNRRRDIGYRISDLLMYFDAGLPPLTMGQWASMLLELERLDEAWTQRLLELKESDPAQTDISGFLRHMEPRQTEYEQLLVYLVYRHLANAADEEELAARAAFAVLGYEIIYAMGEQQWSRSGRFDFEDQAELARLFSSEIEYSDENLDRLLDILAGYE